MRLLHQVVLLATVTLSFGQTKKWSLKECVDYAVKNNITVQQAQVDKDLNQITKKDAIGKFLPNLNANASHSWNIGLNQNITTGLLENQTTQFTSVGANASVDIFGGLQNVNQLRKANLSLIAAQYQLTKIQEDVALNVANAYLQILFSKENVKVQTNQNELLKKQLERTKELVDIGNIPKGDLLDIEASLASSNQQVIIAKNSLFLAKVSLVQLLRLDDYQNFDVVDEEVNNVLSSVLGESVESVIAKAKETRTELKLVNANLEVAKKDIQIAKGAYYPTLTGFYGFNTRASNSDGILFNELGMPVGTKGPDPLLDQFDKNKGHNFGLQLNIPIFNGFATRNNVQRAKLNFKKIELSKTQQELDIERNVFTAYTDTQAANKSYEAAAATLKARTLALDYAKERYENGMLNIFDLNQAQTNFVNAQSDVIRTKYDLIFRIKVLEFYFGIPLIEKQ